MQMIKVGSDFSGVGAFNQALKRLGIEFDEIFACDMDKFARQTFIHNYGEPKYYPENVYNREIPSESLDIYMTSPPCQAFSLAGKRLGKDDERGILFFNSHEFIKKNKPRYFIFENVKGLLSDDNGKTFGEWVRMLGGKSVNGLPVLFPDIDSVPYHIFYKVLNAKKHGVPQNRERVFIIGIRDDNDLTFRWPKEERLTKKLKDVLESDVDEKYFLSEKMIEYISKDRKGNEKLIVNREIANAMTVSMKNCQRSGQDNYIQIKSATSKGYETATENDSINLSVPNSETRRGRVGKGVAQTLDTSCNQGIWVADFRTDEGLRIRKDNISPCMTASMKEPNEKMSRGNCVPFVGNDYKIRRLTPRECFRLMDFPDSFTWPVSDSQAYKQAGNSIVVGVLEKIIERLNLE
jgi:DNA (cytosine-5)-methyltransferase 1